jgi:hypothetical protein
MLTPFDEYPVHQSPEPIARPAAGHPDFYDRFWFSGFRDDLYFAVAVGVYQNREILDAAFAVVHDGVQRSVFYSGRLPRDRRSLHAGPITVRIVEPFAVNSITVDAPDYQLGAELTYTARTPVIEESRQTRYVGPRLWMDATRATQFGSWQGTVSAGTANIAVADVVAVKDRSWGYRAVEQTAAAQPGAAQAFFLWAPLQFDDIAVHGMVFENADGEPWAATAAAVPTTDLATITDWSASRAAATPYRSMTHRISWAPGLRRPRSASLRFHRTDGGADTVDLDPLLMFRMRGAGYGHPKWAHGRWHGEHAVGGECHAVGELDNVEPANIHVQQVVRATWGHRTGIGVLETVVIGPHHPSGLTGLLDGASGDRQVMS